jgi:hypothetical protein
MRTGVEAYVLSVALAAVACGGQQAAPATAPEQGPAAKPGEPLMTKAPLESPKPCLKGESSCGGGVCDLSVKNDCDGPLTCDVAIKSSCKTNTGFGEASGRKRATFAAKAADKLNIAAMCTEGDVVRTQVSEIKCQ